MMSESSNFTLAVESTAGICPIGETWGKKNAHEGNIPVISCEGACIRGEIARMAANLLSRVEPYRRSCHGEMFTVPGSAIAEWMKTAEKVVVIDGCFLHCHGRVLKHLIGEDRLAVFDAFAIHRKYQDIFDFEDIPAEERKQTARQVADTVLSLLKEKAQSPARSCCDSAHPPTEDFTKKERKRPMDERTKRLIAVGASVGANCHPCVEFHIGKALALGIGREEILAAVEQAQAVRKGATTSMDALVIKLLDDRGTSQCCTGPSCGCS